jgi:hypothetical protein
MDAEFWNNRFTAPQYIYGETPNAFVTERTSQIPAGPVLCPGRLTQRGLLHLSRALRHPIYSRDDLDRFLRETSAPIE